MNRLLRLQQSRFTGLILGLVLIGFGSIGTVHYGRGLLVAYLEIEFARHHNFETGPPDLNLIRPWMNIRYLAVAYTVPQTYLFDRVGLPLNEANSVTSLRRLSNQIGSGSKDEQAALVTAVHQAIVQYQAHPTPTGLQEGKVTPWMSVQYIANSTGLPAEFIFEQIGLPAPGHAFMTLEHLSDETGYSGGQEALIEATQRVIDTSEAPHE